MNIDCLASILANVSVRDRQTFRLVNRSWSEAVYELDRTQQALSIIGRCALKRSSSQDEPSQSSWSVIRWPGHYMRHACLESILTRFHALKSLSFECIDPWNDRRLCQLVAQCSRIQKLSFVRCFDLGRSRPTGICELNVTPLGWHRLVEAYGQQVTQLTLQDCDLDDTHLEIVVRGFQRLRYLDIAGNRMITSQALAHICPDIQVLKVGPKLTGPGPMGSVPIEPIVCGHGRYLQELHLQGFLDAHLALLANMPRLEKLVLRFMRPAFDDPVTCGHHLSLLGRCGRLRSLEVYQHNAHDSSMALSGANLASILQGCSSLEKLTINCDIWCESPFDDSLIATMVDSCPRLVSIDLCPGNFCTTDRCLEALARSGTLQHLRLVEFNGITGHGLIGLLKQCKQLQSLVIEDCCDLDTPKFIAQVRELHALRMLSPCLQASIVPLRSLETPPQVVHLASNVTITVGGYKDRFQTVGTVHKRRSLFERPENACQVLTWLSSRVREVAGDVKHWLALAMAILTIIAYLGYGLGMLTCEWIANHAHNIVSLKSSKSSSSFQPQVCGSWVVLGLISLLGASLFVSSR